MGILIVELDIIEAVDCLITTEVVEGVTQEVICLVETAVQDLEVLSVGVMNIEDGRVHPPDQDQGQNQGQGQGQDQDQDQDQESCPDLHRLDPLLLLPLRKNQHVQRHCNTNIYYVHEGLC